LGNLYSRYRCAIKDKKINSQSSQALMLYLKGEGPVGKVREYLQRLDLSRRSQPKDRLSAIPLGLVNVLWLEMANIAASLNIHNYK